MPISTVDQNGDEAWRAAVDRVLKGASFVDVLTSRTADDIAVEPLYRTAETASVQSLRRTSQPVIVTQRVDHPQAPSANALALADLEGGAGALTIAFEGASSARDFGLGCTEDDLGQALAGVHLDLISLRLESAPLADQAPREALLGLIEARKLDPARLDVDFGLDPIGALAQDGVDQPDWEERVGAVLRQVRGRGFGSPVLRADGRIHQEAGASEGQELAAVLATGVTYLRALEAGGLALDEARAALSFTLAVDSDMLLSVAKLRAVRQLWSRVETACGIAPQPLRLHAETAWRCMTRRDPYGNLLRGTIGAAAAVLGGADSLTVLPFTAALGLPDAHARRLARNTALILLEEASLGRVTDPAGGSGAFEALTAALCEKAWALFQGIEAAGGFPAALRSGFWQAALEATRRERQAAIANGTRAIVGTSVFAGSDEIRPLVLMEVPASGRAVVAPAFRPLRPERDAEPFEHPPTFAGQTPALAGQAAGA